MENRSLKEFTSHMLCLLFKQSTDEMHLLLGQGCSASGRFDHCKNKVTSVIIATIKRYYLAMVARNLFLAGSCYSLMTLLKTYRNSYKAKKQNKWSVCLCLHEIVELPVENAQKHGQFIQNIYLKIKKDSRQDKSWWLNLRTFFDYLNYSLDRRGKWWPFFWRL